MNTPIDFPHRDTCSDRTVRQTESIFDRGNFLFRCLGCGRTVRIPKAAR